MPRLWGGLGLCQPPLGGVLLLHVGVVVQLLEGLGDTHKGKHSVLGLDAVYEKWNMLCREDFSFERPVDG